MASALQCPACGHKHRLTALAGDPVFACEQCGRLLKTPAEYRRPEPSGPIEAPRPNGNHQVQRGGSATRDQTSVLETPRVSPAGAGAGAGAAAARKPRPPRRSSAAPAPLKVPLLILGWVIAVVLGGVIVRYFAKLTGLVTGDSVIDIITGSGFFRYVRVFALVPFWALATAGLMTLFVEGARRWAASRGATPARRPAAPPTRAAAPPPKARPPAPKPSPVAPSPKAAETRSPTDAAAAPRARRIPKRDISS